MRSCLAASSPQKRDVHLPGRKTPQAAGDADAQAAACSAARTSAKVAEAKIEATRARLRRAQAELERAYARAPMDGRVLEVLARPGERVGPDGVLELGRVSRMYAIAEVYETDIGRVRIDGEGRRSAGSSCDIDRCGCWWHWRGSDLPSSSS